MSDSNSGVQTSKVANFFSTNGWWYAAAALMLVVVLGIIAILMLPSDSNGSAAPPSTVEPTAPTSSPDTTSTEATSPAPATDWEELGCNGRKGDTAIPTLAPDAEWEPLGVMSAPVSERYGPTQTDGFVRTCYQHTPTGAVFAAVNMMTALAAAPDADVNRVIETTMTPGAYRDETLGGERGAPTWRFRAFHVESCDAARCNVVLVVQVPGGVLARVNAAMVWVEGDWRRDGTQNPGGGVLESVPAGYVSWGA